jgi:hypothetical protein
MPMPGIATLGTLVVASLLVFPNISRVGEFVTLRTTAGEFAAHLKDAQQSARSLDVDRRIRLATETGYVIEKRAGAGWLVESTHVLPEGFEISGPEATEFYARGNVGPTVGYVITGSHGGRRDVITEKKGRIYVK